MRYWLVPTKNTGEKDRFGIPKGPKPDCGYPHRVIHHYPNNRGYIIACEEEPELGLELNINDSFAKKMLETHGEKI